MSVSMREIKNDNELDTLLNKTFTGRARIGYLEVGDDKYCLPVYFKNYSHRIKNFQVQNDDVYIAAHPKTGTTWLQEMIWLLVNDLNYDVANSVIQYQRFPLLETDALFDLSDYDTLHRNFSNSCFVENLKSPRCIKTHLPWSLLPEDIKSGAKTPKIVTVLRRAEDVCISHYHHSKAVEGYRGTCEEFCELFLGGRVCFGPFWKQVFSYWEQKGRENILFLKYKDMKEDLSSAIKTVANFLGKDLNEQQIQGLMKHLSFESMKNNIACNNKVFYEIVKNMGHSVDANAEFIRKGEVGGFKSDMSPELIERFKIWTEENTKGTDLCIE